MVPDFVLKSMVPPSQRRPSAWRNGIMQIHVTRLCDLACSNCTQGSQFSGKSHFITPENFELACRSLRDYFGLVGVFGGNPALHPQFSLLCEILRSHFAKDRCGIWCNHPRGKAQIMRQTFNPAMSNLNVHLVDEAFSEFKADWPESRPFGLQEDSKHSPVHGAMREVLQSESDVWVRVGNCDINKHWSAMMCQVRGNLFGFFCEVAGGQAVMRQDDPDYQHAGMQISDQNLGWWKSSMNAFESQIETHCTKCLVPLRGVPSLARSDKVTKVGSDYQSLAVKTGHTLLPIVDVSSNDTRKFVDYMR